MYWYGTAFLTSRNRTSAIMSRIVNKSCIVVTRFSHDQPGFLDFIYRIKSLTKEYRVTVVSQFSLDFAEFEIEGVDYIVLDFGNSGFEWPKYLWGCAKLIRTRCPDRVVLLHTFAAPVSLLAGCVPSALYWNEHPLRLLDTSKAKAAHKRLFRWLMYKLIIIAARRSTLVMPVGEAHLESVLESGCDPSRVKMIYMGVDPTFWDINQVLNQSASRLIDAPVSIVYTGSVAKERGRDVMLEAMFMANKTMRIAHLTIVGASDEEFQYCKRFIESNELKDCVKVIGRVPGAMIPSYLKGADVGICLMEDKPWWRFNPPTKLFEYLVAGLPVLGSNIRTHTQYIKDWDNGLIFEYTSANLAQTIFNLYTRRVELHRMKCNAIKGGQQHLWEKIEPIFLNEIRAMK